MDGLNIKNSPAWKACPRTPVPHNPHLFAAPELLKIVASGSDVQ
jgi:hypothetical protein